MRVENFLDISLLGIWQPFPWNFSGCHKDNPYLVLLVGESPEIINASGQSFSQHTFTVMDFSSSRTPLYLLCSQLCRIISSVHRH
jgi:hypothetical protein